MAQVSIAEVLTIFKDKYGLTLSKLAGKRIIFENESKSIVVAIPSSKIHVRGNGWVDLTKIQVDLFKSKFITFVNS